MSQRASLRLNSELEKETKETKTFQQDIFLIAYENNSKIFFNESDNSIDVKVKNYLCTQKDQSLIKVTEIIYEDKLIRIEDRFDVSVDKNKVQGHARENGKERERENERNRGSKNEKIRIFIKERGKNRKTEKKDKKNIVKNIVKIFCSWLEKKAENQNEEIKPALIELKYLMERENFNNRLITNIINSAKVCKSFLQFLQDDVTDQIKYSRIQDKDSHYEAIELYIHLIERKKNEKNEDEEDQEDQEDQEENISEVSMPSSQSESNSESESPIQNGDNEKKSSMIELQKKNQKKSYSDIIRLQKSFKE